MKLNINYIIISVISVLSFSLSCSRQYDENLNIYFVRTGNIYQISESGEDLKLILGGSTYNYPCSSPDGKYILCRYGAISAIYNLESMAQVITFATASPYTHSWSPDGSKIGTTDGPGQLKVYDVASGVKIWEGSFGGRVGHYFTIDSKYVAETTGSTLKEFLPETDIIAERTVVLPGTYNNLSLSYDGKYMTGDDGSNVIIIDASTLTAQVIAAGTQPSWSPDSDLIVYVNSGNIYIYDINGGTSHQLTASGTDSYPSFQYKPR